MKFSQSYFSKCLFLLGDSKKQAGVLVILFLFSSILDIIGISIIAPYITLIINPESLTSNDFYIYLLGFLKFENDKEFIIFIGYILIFIFLSKSILGIFINRKILNYCYNRGYVIRTSLFTMYQKMPYSEFVSHNKSEFIHRVQDVTYAFSQVFLQSVLRFCSEIIVALVILIFLFYKEPYAVLLLLMVLIPVTYTYDLIFKNKVSKLGIESNNNSRKIIKDVNQGIEGLKEIRILGCEDYFNEKVRVNSKRYAVARVNEAVISGIPRYLVESSLVVFLVILVFSLLSTNSNADEIFPVLSMFGLAAIRLAPSINQISSGLSQIRYGQNTIEILFKDYKKYYDSKNEDTKDSRSNFKKLELHGISFGYSKSRKIINGISLSIRKGETIGIVGGSGSGKTTLVDLLIGVLEPDSGIILYNGESLQSKRRVWQSKIAYLPQDTFITDDSLKNNIALGIEECDVDEILVNDAIRKSKLSKLVSSWPDGHNTNLGDGGLKLSGGQKQRVALARAFYHQREVLIMDESTSSLDSQTENEIVNEINLLKDDKTIIIIAHRITTLKHCDRILVMEDGRVIKAQSYDDYTKSIGNVNTNSPKL